jgi:hypothetical protein
MTATTRTERQMEIEACIVTREDFRAPCRAIESLLEIMSAEEKEPIVAIEQEIAVQHGRLDRFGITKAVCYDGTKAEFRHIVTMSKHAMAAGSIAAQILQSSNVYNYAFHQASSTMAEAEGKNRDQRFEGRALYMPQGILLISDDDFRIEVEIQTEELPDGPYLVGQILLPQSRSNHEEMENALAAKRAAGIVSSLLNYGRDHGNLAVVSIRNTGQLI